jgi:hypothetical protein
MDMLLVVGSLHDAIVIKPRLMVIVIVTWKITIYSMQYKPEKRGLMVEEAVARGLRQWQARTWRL